jgi:class 3 adenylate cyclase
MPSEPFDPPSSQSIAALSMTEIIRLQELLSRELKRRFEKQRALAFSDVVGSTDYFARFGDEAGRRLQQRHFDLLVPLVVAAGGRIVETGGDGAFVVFGTMEAAASAFVALEKAIALDNQTSGREHQLSVRIGLHFGPVLTDEVLVTGDAVNLAARVTQSAMPGEIRLTRDAFQELPSGYRLRACPLPAVELKGIARPVTVFALDWRDPGAFPDAVRIEETGQEIVLPNQDTIRFGRLKESDGVPANDIVLVLADETATRKISRWHFELRRSPDAFMLRSVSQQPTEVDGRLVARGTEVAIKPGSTVRVGRVLTLQFFSDAVQSAPGADDATLGSA